MHFNTIDAHVAGGAVRLVTAGLPRLDGAALQERSDSLARIAGGRARGPEPRAPRSRGHGRRDAGRAGSTQMRMRGSFSSPADGPIALCGHGLLGATALGLARGLIVPRRADSVVLDTLAGSVTARIMPEASSPARVSYSGAAARVIVGEQARRDRPAIGARGSRQYGRRCARHRGRRGRGRAARRHADGSSCSAAASKSRARSKATRVGGVVFIGIAPERGVDMRSATVYADGVVERSPGGSSTVALAAVLTAMGALATGQRLVHQGLFGSTLDATVNALVDGENGPAFEVEVTGEVWPTGDHEFVFHDGDPTRQPDM